jgi:hypothetical protein
MAFWRMAYKFGWATETDLDTAVAKGFITVDQKNEIMSQ